MKPNNYKSRLGLRLAASTENLGDHNITKAPYDQTYISSIIGVNRKFVDNISSDKQNDLIERFVIPETIEEGEYNYYIFQINGTEYCARQNGDFKLYDKIMVYIPNGDWSALYIDYPDAYSSGTSGGGGSGSDISLPDCTVAPDAPGGLTPNIGDLWIVVNDDTIDDFTNITTDSYVKMCWYGNTEDDLISQWRQVKVAVSKTSAGVDINTDDYWIRLDDDNKTFLKIYKWQTSGSSTTFYEIYPEAEQGVAPNLTISIKAPMKEGDFWIKISDDEYKKFVAFYIYSFDEENSANVWKLVFNAGASELGNGLEYDAQGRIRAKLGEGLEFDENGAIVMAYNPVVNIANALVYKKV